MRLRTIFSAVCSMVFLAGCLSSGVKESPLGPCEERLPTAEAFEIEVSRGSIAFVDVFEDSNASANGCGTLQLVADSWQDGEKGIVYRSEDRPNELAYLADREAIGDDVFSYRLTNGFNELEVNVSVRVYQRLTLEGSFPHGWVTDPEVDVRGDDVGGTGEVTANGVFEIELRLFNLESDKSSLLTVAGTRNGSPLTLHSMLPGTQSVYAARSGDNRVTDTGVAGLRVNALTTAYSMLVNGASAQALQLNEDELAWYGRAVDTNRLANTAGWIYLLATNSSYKMPEGYETTWELGAELEALTASVEEAQQAGDLAPALETMLANRDLMPSLSNGDVEGRFTELGSQVPWWPQSTERSWVVEADSIFWLDGYKQLRTPDYTTNGALIRVNDALAPFEELYVLASDDSQLVLWSEGEAFRLERKEYSQRLSLAFDLTQDWVLPALPVADEGYTQAEVVYSFSNGSFTTSHVDELGTQIVTTGSYQLTEDNQVLAFTGDNGERYRMRRVNNDGIGSVLVENIESAALMVGSGFVLEDVEPRPQARQDDIFSLRDVRAINSWDKQQLIESPADYISLNSSGTSGTYRLGGRNFQLSLTEGLFAGIDQTIELRLGDPLEPAESKIYWKILKENTTSSFQVLEWTVSPNGAGDEELTGLPRVNVYCKKLSECATNWW